MSVRVEHLAEGVTLYLGDCIDVIPTLGPLDHIISDPPYEASLHASKNNLTGRKHRNDGVAELKGLDFAPIDAIRSAFVDVAAEACTGWLIAFCTVEGVAKWADCINASTAIKYKRACVWVKPDSTPQLNGQGPAQGAECFVTAWAGKGHAGNSGGKRGVYTHCVNVGRQGEHPTEKPLPLMIEILRDFSSVGDLVCDSFAGSGTTGIAAVKTGRRFIGIERDPKWFDLSCRRISDALARPDLFIETPKPSKQEALQL
jgi:site-specific DNA-methyltransferase (adenine-specific)